MSIEHKLGKTYVRCNCGMQYKSVVEMGRISFITKKEDKVEALKNIASRYTKEDKHYFKDNYVDITNVLSLDIDEISGKKCIL